jgi:acetyltransferase-like isoleucine patch superfamily enzyme
MNLRSFMPGNILRRGFRLAAGLLERLALALPCFHFIRNTRDHQTSITFSHWFFQKVLGFNREVYWPVHFTSKINQWRNIQVGVDVCPGYEPGCYIQGLGKVVIGDYTQIAQNVGIISANHDVHDCRHHEPAAVEIGSYCWIGMNSVVLPGVKLGDFTVVGAGSVVTKSFPEGHCVVVGNPARKIRDMDVGKCIRSRCSVEYVGYIPAVDFSDFSKRNLRV